MGLPAIAATLANVAEPEGFAVWPENMPVIDAWLIVSSQWRAIAMADGRVLWLGLDYTAAKTGLDVSGVTLTPTQWSKLRLVESVVAAAFNGRN